MAADCPRDPMCTMRARQLHWEEYGSLTMRAALLMVLACRIYVWYFPAGWKCKLMAALENFECSSRAELRDNVPASGFCGLRGRGWISFASSQLVVGADKPSKSRFVFGAVAAGDRTRPRLARQSWGDEDADEPLEQNLQMLCQKS